MIPDVDKLGLVFETTAVNRWSTGTPDLGSELIFGWAAGDISTRFALFLEDELNAVVKLEYFILHLICKV